MPNKTLYVRDEDLPLWDRAERAAKEARQSLSQYVAAALDAHMTDNPRKYVELHGGN